MESESFSEDMHETIIKKATSISIETSKFFSIERLIQKDEPIEEEKIPEDTCSSLDPLESFNLHQQLVKFFPRDLQRTFGVLTSVSIVHCHLQEILRRDIKQLDKLEVLNLSYNKLKSLPDDLFIGKKELREIHFQNNQLGSLSSKLLLPIARQVELADFRDNAKINAFFEDKLTDTSNKRLLSSISSVMLDDLMKLMDEKCSPPIVAVDVNELLTNIFNQITTGSFFDFQCQLGDEVIVKRVLYSFTNYNLISSNFNDKDLSSILSLEDFCDWAHNKLSRHFQTGDRRTFLGVLDLYKLSSFLPSLKLLCEKIIDENVDVSNIYDVFSVAYNELFEASSYNLKVIVYRHMEELFPNVDMQKLIHDLSHFDALLAIRQAFDRADRSSKTGILITAHMKASLDGQGLTIFKTTAEVGGSENCLWIRNCVIERFPRRLNNTFPDILILHLSRCGLREISRTDLIGLEHLEELDLSENNLTSLPNNLFVYMKRLKMIDFSRNQLKRLSYKLLMPVWETLVFASFEMNPLIDECYVKREKYRRKLQERETPKSSVSFEALLKIIDKSCYPPIEPKKIFNANFDFCLKCSGKEFRVREADVVAASPIFAKMIAENAPERRLIFSDDYKPSVVRDLALFLNSRLVEFNENFTTLFELAEKYDIPDLTVACAEVICDNFEKFHLYEALSVGRRLKSYEIQRLALLRAESMLPVERLDEKLLENSSELVKLIDLNEKLIIILQFYKK